MSTSDMYDLFTASSVSVSNHNMKLIKMFPDNTKYQKFAVF